MAHANQYPLLYSFRRCPYAMRGRMALAISGIICIIREVHLKNKPAHMLEISPKGTVPVLQLPDGTIIEESLDVMSWALSQNDPENWAPANDTARQEMLELITQNDKEFAPANYKYKYWDRFPEENRQENRDKAAQFPAQLEIRLQNQKFLLGDTPTQTDFAIFPFIRQFAANDKEWFQSQDWPNLQKWLEYFLNTNVFQQAMTKYDVWKDGDEIKLFPE